MINLSNIVNPTNLITENSANTLNNKNFGTNPTFNSGTANGLLYLNSSKVMSSDSSLTFDGTNLGIGTSSPTLAKLQISQTSNTAGGIYAVAASGQNGNVYVFGISGVSNGYRITNDGSNNIQHIWDGTGGAERMRLDSSGNVGIGTNSPGAKLHVDAGGNNEAVRLNAASTFNTSINWYNAGSIKWSTQTLGDGSNAFRWYNFTTNSEAMRLDSSGNLGIGTSSPATKFEVSGSSAGAVSTRITNTENASQYLSIQMSGGTAFGVPGWDNSGVIEAVADGVGSGTRALYLSAYNGPLIFATGNGNRNERMRLTSTGLGIGTSSPQDTLDITRASGTTAIRIASQGAGSLTWRLASQLVGVANAGFVIRDETNGVNRLAIDGSGNVGIGTSSPGYRLDTLLGAGSGNIFRAGQSGVSNGYTITTNGSALTHVWANGGSDAMRLDSSGNLGLGVTPSLVSGYSGMQINGGGNGSVLHLTNSTTGTSSTDGFDLIVLQGGSDAYVWQRENAPLIFGTNSTERARIDSSGNLHIGGTGMSGKLNVYAGGAGGVGWGTGFNIGSSSSYYGIIQDGGIARHRNFGGGGFDWYNQNATQTMSLNSSGNLSISGTLTEASTRRIKTNIRPITNALSVVSNLQGVLYDRIDGTAKDEPGLIAEDTLEAIENLVVFDDDGQPAGVKYTKTVAYLIEAIKELKQEIDTLKK